MIYQPSFRAYQWNYWPRDVLSENMQWSVGRFLNCDECHEILWYHAREERIALSVGLAECFALLEENMQSTNRLYLDMIQNETE